MKTVKVAFVPGTVKEVAAEDNATLDQILEIAGINAEGYDVRIGDTTATMTVIPADGTKIYLVKQVKGNL